MNVQIVENLGDWVSFDKDTVKVNKALFDAIPEVKQNELEIRAWKAYEDYKSSVQLKKQQGEKVVALSLKKKALDDFKKWVNENKEASSITISPRVPRIPDNNEVISIRRPKQEYFADTAVSLSDVDSIFNSFNSDTLPDSEPEVEEIEETSSSVSLDDELFESLDSLDDLLDI